VQRPRLTNVAADPETVQTDAVDDASVTARPDDAVAAMENGPGPKGWLAMGAKVMVWLPAATMKVWSTGVAAE
jgi:hypothetical protein